MTRLFDRLVRTQAQIEAEELARDCARPGCRPISDLVPREVGQVTGVVHSLAVQPADAAPRLTVELYDGTGVLRVIWLGRREIPGIRPGVYLTVQGRVCEDDGGPAMYNPVVHLLPHRD